jgi:D-alanyl-D-alanine carboxypeptidase
MLTERGAVRSLFRTLAVAVVAAAIAASCGTSRVQDHSARRAKLSSILSALASGQQSGTIAFVETPSARWHGAAGHALDGRPADAHDRFGIESVTKTFVAAVALQLVGEKRLSLDDKVEKWLPGRVRDGNRITIRELMNHTSGLASGMPTEFPPLRDQPRPLFRPGTSESYANLNYAVLGAIVEKASGQRLDRAVNDRILRPLHLTNTGYGPSGVAADHKPSEWLGSPESRPLPVTGDVGIVSTTDDLASFFAALLGGAVVPRPELQAMERTVGTATAPRPGLGLFRTSLPCGSAWGHGGNDNGYSDQVLASSDGSEVVVVAEDALDETAASSAAAALFCAAK